MKYVQLSCLFILFVIVPLIIWPHTYTYVSPLFSLTQEIVTHEASELYAFWKWVVFGTVTVLFVGTVIFEICRKNEEIYKTFTILCGIVIGCFLISAYFSTESYIAFTGVGNRYDGSFTYVLLIALMWGIVHSRVAISLRTIVYATIPFSVINVVLSVSYVLELPWTIARYGATLANANVTSAMFALLLVLTIYYVLVSEDWKILIVTTLNAIGLLSCLSVVGFLLFLIGLVGAALFTRKWTISIVFLLGTCIIAFVFNQFEGRVLEESFGVFSPAETSIDERLENKLQEPINNVIAYEDRYPDLPAIATTALSSREYIWQKTWGLITERPLFGYGMDTLRIHFPHFNEDARAGISTPRIIVDKAHSMFFGTLYGAGAVTCIAILVLIGYVTLRAKKLTTAERAYALCIGLFFVQGFTNDNYMGINVWVAVLAGLFVRSILQKKSAT